jgi:hypothetical protein
MSRPKPVIKLEHINKNTYKSDQVLEADGIYAVFCDGKPINLKTQNILIAGSKYKKCSFANRGHAVNLCRKLNILFKTNLFTVVLLRAGDQVFP